MGIRLGYACISIPMRNKNIYTGRTLTLKSLQERGIAAAKLLAEKNIDDLITIIEFNEKRGFRFFRITSNLFPHIDNPLAKGYNIDFARDKLATAGALARSYGHRLTMHPGQFAQLGSPRPEVVDQTIRDLTTHADILTAMGMTPSLGSVMIIHGGGTFGDKKATLARWVDNFKHLPKHAQEYISLENDEWQYSVLDLLPICEELSIPLCIDYFHHSVGHADQFNIYDSGLIARVMNTWKLRGIKPKCHWSNQAQNSRKGAHGDCVDDIPVEILKICAEYDCDIMIEAKKKDECSANIYEKYFNRSEVNNRVEWYIKDQYKY